MLQTQWIITIKVIIWLSITWPLILTIGNSKLDRRSTARFIYSLIKPLFALMVLLLSNHYIIYSPEATFLVVMEKFWELLMETSLFLLIGFMIVVGIKQTAIGQWFRGIFDGEGVLANIKATLAGAPFIICSCAIVPVARTLIDEGSKKGVTCNFLISCPETDPVSTGASFYLLGFPITCARLAVALFTSFFTGLVVGFSEKKVTNEIYLDEIPLKGKSYQTHSKRLSTKQAFKYAFMEMPNDIAPVLFYSLLLSGLMLTYITPETVASMGFDGSLMSNVLLMLMVIVVSIPLYICSLESTPIGLCFLLLGFSPGVVIVFLVAGPATNFATIKFIFKKIGVKTGLVFFASIICTTLLGGLTVDWLLSDMSFVHRELSCWIPYPVKLVSTIIMFVLSIYALVQTRLRNRPWDYQEGAERSSCCDHH